MDFVTSLKVVLRHWYLVVPALLLSVAGAFFVVQSVSPSFRASGTQVLLTPQVLPDIEAGDSPNPLLEGGLTTAGDVIVARMTDPPVLDQLEDDGATASWEIQQPPTRTPLLVTVVTGGSEADVLKTLDVVMTGIGDELIGSQVAVGVEEPENQIRTRQIRKDVEAQAGYGSRTRALLALLALGIAFSISLAFIADAMRTNRRKRREPARPADELGDLDDVLVTDELTPRRAADDTEAPAEPVALDDGLAVGWHRTRSQTPRAQ